ncbi:NAD(P)-dependent alcohol dehydrogenase [Nocardia sp. CNY236]|uniref:NAD(P)-dependent alcohol dehydrogenase n=1 Tax=Nocardia sp. CNY236 TaxID=1169152 RepID=UPI0012DE690F|nr:NAD(P)-dependent alcohol dehydrogenase [Nocardia sp. CNY236]
MKAIVQAEYGAPAEVLQLRDIDLPTPEADSVVVRVHATSVNPADWHVIRGVPHIARLQVGLRRPNYTVPGCDVAGQVESVGADVTGFRPGDEVFGSPFLRGFGAFAEYVSIPADRLAHKPANLSFEQAATVPLAASTALQGLRDHAGVDVGTSVLIVGAAGGVGTFAVQLAKQWGAEVTGVCGTGNVELVRSLGADHVIDYTRVDFTRGEHRYDAVFQVSGTHSASDYLRILAPDGTLVLAGGDSDNRWIGPMGRLLTARLMSSFVSQRLTSFTVAPNAEDLVVLREAIEAGAVNPVIDRSYLFDELPAAIGYLERGHARGKIVVAVK